MPKRGGGNVRFNNNINDNDCNASGSRFSSLKHYEHEGNQRKKDHTNIRRVSFKASQLQHAGGIKSRLKEMAIRSHLEDDEDMGDFVTSRYEEGHEYVPRVRKGSPIPKKNFGNKRHPSTLGWYQVMVQGGQRYSKDEITRILNKSLAPYAVTPLYFRLERHAAIFYVDDYDIAQRLPRCDRTVRSDDGYFFGVKLRPGVPNVTVDDEYKERMKLAMVKRYNASTHALDLTKFHADADLKGIFCGLYRGPILTAVVDIIAKNIPDLEALNLSENSISTMEAFKGVEKRLPNLKILYMGQNSIQSLAHLLVLRNVPIIDLMLKNNPLCSRYKDHKLYVSEVRRKFPKLMRLDGEQLERQVLFDGIDTHSLPTPKASFLCDIAGTDMVREFLKQYFLIFDSDNRQPLLDAYHEQAYMSICMPPASIAGRLQNFWKYNRNFRRPQNDDQYKIRNLKVGRLAVVSTLAELPKTHHDPESFSVDLILFTPKLICFSVAGLFKEIDVASGTSDIRYFQRQMVVVPANGGFCIRNEMIYITSSTGAQARTFLKHKPPVAAAPAPAPAAMGMPTMPGFTDANAAMSGLSIQDRLKNVQPSTSMAAAQIPTVMLQQQQQAHAAATTATMLPDNAKMQMVQAISEHTKMNMDWSKKCLEETNWDFNHAVFVFNKLQTDNKIPPEAFIK